VRPPDRSLRLTLRLGFAGLALATALAGGASFAQPAPAPAPPAARLRDEQRLPWVRNDEWFVKTWLVVGPFSSSFDEDALGGEAAARPKADQQQPRRDGPSLKWKALTAWSDAVQLDDEIGATADTRGIAYAFATVVRARGGKALLAIGSDDDVRVFVNGTSVHEHRGRRPLVLDEDRVEVPLKEGDNAVLVKLAQRGGPWAFSLRVLEPGAVLAPAVEIGPFVLDEGVPSGSLSVRTDVAGRAGAPVEVDVVAPGGVIVASRRVARGATVAFDGRAWADGPYEARFTTTSAAGRAWTTHLPWYKGDPRPFARRVVEEAKTADTSQPAGMIRQMLGALVLDRVGGDLERASPAALLRAHSALMEAAELDLDAAGKTGRVRGYGFVRLAWRDDTDGSVQFCRAYLPPGYRPGRRWPMILQLHGFNPANPEYVRWWGVDGRHHGVHTVDRGLDAPIFLEPHGRGNTGYQGLGEKDVLRAIAEAEKLFSVDEDRVGLTGDSMGGWGTWQVGTRNPDLFCGIAPVYGGADYHVQLPEDALPKLDAAEKALWERRSSVAQAESLLNVPVFVLHGDQDKSVNVEYSRWIVRMLQRWGYDVRYRELPGRGHEDMKVQPEVVDWLLQQRRVAHPLHVRLRTAEPQSARAYWLSLDRPDDAAAFQDADAEVIGPNRIRLDTRNVLAATLRPGPLVDAAKPVEVVWNGVARSLPLQDGAVALRAEGDRPAALAKSRATPGRFNDVWNTPFAIVVGTVSADPAMRKACEWKGRAAVDNWRTWQRQTPRVFEDTEIGEADLARYSLVLVGGPADNAVARRLADRIPLAVTQDAFVIDGTRFEARDAMAAVVYPSPLNPERYVAVVAGTSPGGLWFWEPGDRNAGDWDFYVVDGRSSAAAASIPPGFPERGRIVSGLFDRDWRLREASIVRGDAELRAKAAVSAAPVPVDVDPAVFDRLVGTYDVGPGTRVAVKRDGSRLMAVEGQEAPVELLPESETTYFLLVQNLRVVFETDASGRATGLVVKAPGRDIPGKRID
jgi:dienelactone hydrolase